jgi:hypothetical protein
LTSRSFAVQVPANGVSVREVGGENRRRDKRQPEFELLDTAAFDEDRYLDVFVEYAKADIEDILIKITVTNRGPAAANLRLVPIVWFRNTWSWGNSKRRPELNQACPVPQPND